MSVEARGVSGRLHVRCAAKRCVCVRSKFNEIRREDHRSSFRTDRVKTVDWEGAALDNIDRNINHNNLGQFLSHPALFP